jgi:DNA-binding CsgD family transcriptional regulator
MWHTDPPLHDRDDELTAIDGALHRARAGVGSIIALEGAAGSGKSSLLGAGRELAAGVGMRVLSARGGELERDFPFGVVRQLFEPLLATASEDRRSRLLAGAAAPAAWALGLPHDGTGTYAAGFAAWNAIYWLTAQLASERPLLLSVDDAHWGDPSSLRTFDFLARRLDELAVVLIVSLRPEEVMAPIHLLDPLRTSAGAIRRVLQPLAAASVVEIVRERVAGASPEMCEACHAVTAGNPFYLEELLRALPEDEADVLSAVVPSLADRVLRRVARVSAQAPALTRAMAVLGDGSRLATACALADIPEGPAAAIAHQLRRLEVLTDEDPIAFVHPLVRGSVYDATPERDRQSAHRRAARLLRAANAPAEAVAAHLQMVEPSGDDEVTSALLAAADRALELAAPDEAIEMLERALAEGAQVPPRGELLARLGAARMVVRDPRAIEHLREARQSSGEASTRGHVAVMLAELLALVGQWDEAVDVLAASEAELDGTEPELATEIAAVRAAVSLFDPSRVAELDAHRGAYVELSRGDGWASRALAAVLASQAAHRGQPDLAATFAERALEGGVLVACRGGGAWATPHVIGAFVEAERLERAEETIRLLRAAGEAAGATLAQCTAVGFGAWVHARRGDLAAAEADLATALTVAEQTGLMMGITSLAFLLGDVLLERDGVSTTIDLVENVQLGPDFLNTASGAMLLEVRGRLRLLNRESAQGMEDLRAAGETFTTLDFGPALSSWRSSLALALPFGDRSLAQELAAEELELARSTGLDRCIGVALRGVGILSDRDIGLDLLRQSVETLEVSPARLEHARSLVELGGAMRRANRRSDARHILVRGLELAHECGAHRLSRRAHQELLAAGSRRSRFATSGHESLTASESRVIELAAAGSTNTEIAQKLYVTSKTVETHLTRAYAKLGLGGRGARSRLSDVLQLTNVA